MAQSYTTNNGVTLYDPGTYVESKVVAGQSGIAGAGIVTIIGEADEGPHWSEEEELDKNAFAPSETEAVISKYKSGRIVDAFKALSAPSADPAITGSVTLVKIVKTNKSTKASRSLSRSGFGEYANMVALIAGTSGNSIRFKSEVSQEESVPTTGSFGYFPKLTGNNTIYISNNGASTETVSISALTAPDDLVASIEDVNKGIYSSGGDKKLFLSGNDGVSLTATKIDNTHLDVSLASGQFSYTPVVGDIVVIPQAGDYGVANDSVVIGGSSANRGSYIVTASTTDSVSLEAINVAGNVEASVGTIQASIDDMILYKPISISNYTGQDRKVADGLSVDWSCSVNDGTNITLGITSGERWTARPKAGDIMVFTATFAGITAGFYLVVSANKDSVTAARLSNGSAGTTGTETNAAATFVVSKPVIDGLGKAMEISGNASDIFKDSEGNDVTFMNSLLVSSAEYINKTSVIYNKIVESFEVGGNILLKVGSENANAQMIISDNQLEIKEGAVSIKIVKFDEIKTLSDLVDLLNSIDGYSAALGNNKFGYRSLSELDKGTYDLVSDNFMPARIKNDAYLWNLEVSGSAFLNPVLNNRSGLPEYQSLRFLEDGAKGSTSSADISNAIDAVETVITNFVVPLYSQDATADIIEGETDSASTYTIDAINSLIKSHCIKMSAVKARANRMGLVSKVGNFKEVSDAAGDLTSFRTALAFEPAKQVASDGTAKTYQPWMTAILAAGMQSAAGYKGIVKKFINTLGILPVEGFDPKNYANREQALRNGLLFAEPVNTGGYRWTSDQTTYTLDNNFVFNSLQAVYVSDLITLSLIDSFDKAFVGQSVAEVSATSALSFLQSQMFNYKRLGWIAGSDDAPAGFKNASAKLNGGVLSISVEVKLAGLIYFVPISLSISQVTQSATI